MRIRVRNLPIREYGIVEQLRYEVSVQFNPDELQSLHHTQGLQIEESIDAIGEGIKSELRRIHDNNKRII
jgi:hypothetical protein